MLAEDLTSLERGNEITLLELLLTLLLDRVSSPLSVQLLKGKFKHKEIKQILAANTLNDMPLPVDDYQLLNPVRHACY